MPTAPVQQVTGDWVSGTSISVSLTATSGNLLCIAIFVIASDNSTTTTGTPGDGVNTYRFIDSNIEPILGTNTSFLTYYARNITGGALTITENLTSSSIVQGRIVVHEVSGASLTSALDQHRLQKLVAPGTGTDAVSSGSRTTISNGEYIFGASLVAFNETLSVGTGFSSGTTFTGLTAAEYQIQSAAGSIAATFTAPTFGTSTFITALATFQPDSTPSGNSYYAVAQQ